MRPAVALILFSAAGLLGGCGRAPGYPPNPMPRPSEVTDFSTLYKENCAACHGVNGQDGPATDLANPEYQGLADDATLRKWISGGMPGTEMPAFAQTAGGMLTDAQVDALIAGMRREWKRPDAFGAAAPPAYAQSEAGDAQRGKASYEARCAGCHAAKHQQLTDRNYLALVSDQALRTVTIAGRPDIGQPDWRHDSPDGKATTPLTAQEVDDIVSYLSSVRGGAAESAAHATPGAGAAGAKRER